jgi:hypothetical protein
MCNPAVWEMCNSAILIPHMWSNATFCFVSMVQLGSGSSAPIKLSTGYLGYFLKDKYTVVCADHAVLQTFLHYRVQPSAVGSDDRTRCVTYSSNLSYCFRSRSNEQQSAL